MDHTHCHIHIHPTTLAPHLHVMPHTSHNTRVDAYVHTYMHYASCTYSMNMQGLMHYASCTYSMNMQGLMHYASCTYSMNMQGLMHYASCTYSMNMQGLMHYANATTAPLIAAAHTNSSNMFLCVSCINTDITHCYSNNIQLAVQSQQRQAIQEYGS